MTAARTLRSSVDFNGVELHYPRVVREQPVGQQSIFHTGQVLDRFGCLNRADGSGDRAENAGLLAVQNLLGWRRRVEETSVAC